MDLWATGSAESVGTDVGRVVAAHLLANEPDDWWVTFVSKYRKPLPGAESTAPPTP
jgi:hypothetical protein